MPTAAATVAARHAARGRAALFERRAPSPLAEEAAPSSAGLIVWTNRATDGRERLMIADAEAIEHLPGAHAPGQGRVRHRPAVLAERRVDRL